MKIYAKNSICLLISIAIITFGYIGCNEDSDENEEEILAEAPILPPDESMQVNTSAFDTKNQGAPGNFNALTMLNYINASTRVVIINSAVLTALSVPAALYYQAKSNEPIEQEDGLLLWSYTAEVEYFTVTANLYGISEFDRNTWSMIISTDSSVVQIEDFEYFRGVSDKLNKSGYWEFFDMQTPEEHNPTVKIEWEVDLLSEQIQLSITNIDTRSEHYQDILLYILDRNKAIMNYDDASNDGIWEIEWNTKTEAGSINVPNYNNGEKACWDANKQDIDCIQ
ncbi:hypothetical protein GF312_20105 [Candidatus Poribacteria bacterium]|nr:hypothetical protein [Candidatus Poribacteria bacterium]